MRVRGWQKPYVDVFKQFNSFRTSKTRGQVKDNQDNDIARRVFHLRGKIPAANFADIEAHHSSNKSLGLTGRFVYFSLKGSKKEMMAIHIDLLLQDGNRGRISLTNMIDKPQRGGVQKPGRFPLIGVSDKWTILCVDVLYLLKLLNVLAKSNFKRKKEFEITGFRLCSNMKVKGIYTSDNLYRYDTLPRDFGFRVPKGGKFEDLYNFRYIPPENFSQAPSRVVVDIPRRKKERKQKLEIESKFPQTRQYVIEPEEKPSSKIIRNIVNPGEYQSAKKVKSLKEKIFSPNPIMRLKRVVGFTGRVCPDIRWTKTVPQRLLFASGNLIVSTDINEEGTQLFYKGHTDSVSCMEISKEGKLLASCQGGEQPILRIWDVESRKTLNKFTLNLKEVRCLSFSYNSELLCVVGSDKLNRDEILIIEIFPKEGTNKLGAKIVARQISEFNILTIKFSPIENDKLVSCGKENIRFWRIKNQHLPGGAVVLNHHARNTVFTVFDFDFGKEENALVAARNDVVKRVLVGSMHGFLYQVNYETRQLEAVFKIHDMSICSISISPGFCVTGSQDQYIRVWPLDFSEFFLEAQHEGVIISLDISLDGLSIGCGTSAGAISVLDLQSQSYKTLLRSHREDIMQLVYQEHSRYLISLSKDCTIRVWKGDHLEQAFEFNFSQQDECVSITPHPILKQFVGGFESGLFRIFDIERVEVLAEHKYHNQNLELVKFSPKGSYIILGDKAGFYTLLNVANDYEFMKTFEPEINNTKISADFTPDEKFLATIGTMNSTINVYSMSNLTLIYSIATKNSFAHTLLFTESKNYELLVLTCEGKIKAYKMGQDNAKFRAEIKDTHEEFISSCVVTPNNKFIISAGGDKSIGVFDFKMRLRKGNQCIRYRAHACPIFTVASDSSCKTIYTAGGQEGIYVWDFLGDVDQYGDIGEDFDDKHLNLLAEGMNKMEEDVGTKHIHFKDNQEDRIIGIHIKGLENQDDEHDMKMEVARGELEIDDYDDIQRELKGIEKPLVDSDEEEKGPFYVEGKLEQTATLVFKSMNNYKEESIRAKLGYLKDHEREKLDIPFKHYYVEHHRWDGLFDKVERLNQNEKIIELEFCTGFNTSSHNNLIWNTRFNCMLYTYENKIILEEFATKRTQSILNLPEYISSLNLSNDGADVAVACATVSPEIFAPVYILDLRTNTLKNRFLFHNRGIQMVKYSPDDSMLLSMGNLKDGKMALWSVYENTLICSTHDINPMHDVDWRPVIAKGPLKGQKEWEFCVAGRNKVTKWRLSSEPKSSLYIQKEKYFKLLGKERDISCVKYVFSVNGGYNILAGMESGCLAIMNEKTLESLIEFNFFNQEISSILYSREQDKLVISSLDSTIKSWNYNSLHPENLDPDTDLKTITLESGVTCLTLDPDFEEGVASTTDGSLNFIDLLQSKFAEFIQGVDTRNGIQQLVLIGKDIIATVHYMGNAKLWNAETGEILKELKWKFSITHVFYADELRRIVFTLQNYDFLTMDINNFNKVKLFKNQNSKEMTQGYMDNYIHKSIRIRYGEQYRYLFSTFKGETLVTDLQGNNVIHFKKVKFPNLFSNISDFDFNVTDNTLAIATNKGEILTYKSMDTSATLENFNFKFIENFDCVENPHGALDQTEEDKEANRKIYQFKSHIVKVRFARGLKHSYVYILESLQYVYIRDYVNMRLKRLITLESFPKCLEIDVLSGKFIVGREDGVLSVINERKGEKMNYQCHFSDEILTAVVTEKNLKYILGADNGFLIYKPVYNY